MASKRKRGNSWEYHISRKALLEKQITLTFSDEAEGDAYVARVERLLDAGIVPPEFVRSGDKPTTLAQLLDRYLDKASITDDDLLILRHISRNQGAKRLTSYGHDAADAWITSMKREERLAPSTIRKRVGALARALDWGIRKEWVVHNPLRGLPRGYSAYTEADGVGIEDEERARRLEPGEEDSIRAVLAGAKHPDRERPLALQHAEALKLLFDLALESAMRMAEMHTLSAEQIDLAARTIFLDKTKNGDKRQVPLSSVALERLSNYINEQGLRTGPLFPWRGTKKQVTSLLSHQFARIFDAAGCPDFRFHDLRHEATSRLYERTQLSDLEIASITGHKDPRMLKRYANLRGSNLATKLW